MRRWAVWKFAPTNISRYTVVTCPWHSRMTLSNMWNISSRGWCMVRMTARFELATRWRRESSSNDELASNPMASNRQSNECRILYMHNPLILLCIHDTIRRSKWVPHRRTQSEKNLYIPIRMFDTTLAYATNDPLQYIIIYVFAIYCHTI